MSIASLDLTATHYFADQPVLDRQKLIDAWGLEGYTCEVFEGHADPIAVLRGGTHFDQSDGRASGWTEGLAFLNMPEIYVGGPTLPMAGVANVLFNVGLQVMRGCKLKPGKSLSIGDRFCTIEGYELNGHRALKISPAE